jgi:hypothetical protein
MTSKPVQQRLDRPSASVLCLYEVVLFPALGAASELQLRCMGNP